MIDIKDLNLNKICPVCGEEIRMIDIHINSLDGVQRIVGHCVNCGSRFEVSQTDNIDEDIKTRWNRVAQSE